MNDLLKHKKNSSRPFLAVSAPMVRYSKLPFRMLVKQHGVDLAYTPMILADSFLASHPARNQEFPVHTDHRDVVQFAANDPEVFSNAVRLVSPYAAAVDLNCGCPQRWAIQENIGAALLKDSELVYSLIRSAKISTPSCQLSVKIRISEDFRETQQFVERVEAAGVSWIAVHGRTVHQRPSDLPDYSAIARVKAHSRVPVLANGDVDSVEKCARIVRETRVDGLMSARPLLVNPALFSEDPVDRLALAKEYLGYAVQFGTTHHVAHHHLSQILTEAPYGPGSLPSHLHRPFHCISSIPGLIDFLDNLS